MLLVLQALWSVQSGEMSAQKAVQRAPRAKTVAVQQATSQMGLHQTAQKRPKMPQMPSRRPRGPQESPQKTKTVTNNYKCHQTKLRKLETKF